MNENEIAKIVVDVCFKIHKKYGSRLFESVYEEKLCYELRKLNMFFVRQVGINVIHDGIDMGIGFKPDLIIERKVILELKSIEVLTEVNYKRLLLI